MAEDETIESMRHELGRDAAQKGDALHSGASEEFRHGYSSWRGGSNVSPKKFGKGSDPYYVDWKCVCGKENRRYHKQCQDCGIRREVAIEANNA